MKLLARGRDADVYELDKGRVLRRYRREGDTRHEATMMQHVRAAGFPAPQVFRAEGPEIEMELVKGPTMLQDLTRRPWRVRATADLLAELMQRLHAIPVVGGSVIHCDFHPGNVVLSPGGPVVIDWTASRIGPPAEDVAQTWLIVATSVPDGGRSQRLLAAAFQEAFAARFLRHFERGPVLDVLETVADARLRDRNVTEKERERVLKLTASYRARRASGTS